MNLLAPAWILVTASINPIGLIGLIFGGSESVFGSFGLIPFLIYLLLAGTGVVLTARLIHWILETARQHTHEMTHKLEITFDGDTMLNIRTRSDEVPWYLRIWSWASNTWIALPWTALAYRRCLRPIPSSRP